MPDVFTKTTHNSWGSRIKDSFKGILVGLLLFLISFPLLFWNEGRAVKMHKSLEEGANNVISVSINSIDSTNENKLIHITGKADTSDVLSDPAFVVTSTAIKLNRIVEMYQWEEKTSSETTKNYGGSSDTETTYSYDKTWSKKLIDSSSFEFPSDHENPSSMPYENQELYAENVNVGAFALTPALIKRIGGATKLPLTDDNMEALSDDEVWTAEIQNGTLYLGDPASPQIGDLRISFEVTKPTNVSIVSQQHGDSFVPYQAKAGAAVELLEMGDVSSEQMFQNAIQANKVMTWILRLLGFFLMFVGLALMLKPLSVFGDVLPFLGNAIGMGTGLLAGLISVALTLITIAIAWLFYRPLLSIILLVIATAAITAIVTLIKKKKGTTTDNTSTNNQTT
ncbi:TMEM43 family protein [Patescibacteria group bacterium]|nr:TMEM43 family protein [Patescibacteria group bacterium]